MIKIFSFSNKFIINNLYVEGKREKKKFQISPAAYELLKHYYLTEFLNFNSESPFEQFLLSNGIIVQDYIKYNPLPMPLSSNVELLFEVIEGLDANDLEVVLAQLGDDIQFEESLVNIDDTQYVGVWTNHFSPYTLFDELTAEEKAAEDQIKTGDQVSLFIISGLGLIMTLALGLMLRINSNKKKFYE